MLTTIRINAAIDRLHLTLSASQIKTLLEIADTLSDEATAKRKAETAAYLQRAKSETSDDQFVATESDSELLARMTLAHAVFEIDSTMLMLCDEVPPESDKDPVLVAAMVRKLQVVATKRTLDLSTSLAIDAIDVVDHYQQRGDRFQYLVHTAEPKVASTTKSTQDRFVFLFSLFFYHLT